MHPSSHGPEARNIILAIALSMLVMVGWQYFFVTPQQQAQEAQSEREQGRDTVQPALPDTQANASEQNSATPDIVLDRAEQLRKAPRIAIETRAVNGSISLKGMRIDDLILKRYRQHVEKDSDPVVLLQPSGTKHSYFAEFGWLAADQSVAVPTSETIWQAREQQITSGDSVRAQWDNGQGLRFEQQISIDDDYLFTTQMEVINNSDEPVTLYPYGLINRRYQDTGDHFFILHEGPLGVFNQELNEVSYGDLRDEGKLRYENAKGWVGITDKYWLSALVPDKSLKTNISMHYVDQEGGGKYQTDFTGRGQTIQPGKSLQLTHRLFAGAKQVSLLDSYSEAHNIPLFDRAVDFGMLYFLTKPIFHALDYFHGLVGNFGVAIMLLTVCIKILLFPLANKSYKSMSQLKVLMPKIQEIKERHGEDRMAMNQEIMQLYKQEKVNPASGCLPILLQLPVFFALYKVLFVTIEMRHAPFFGWIKDLSAPDPTTIANLFGLFPWDPPTFLMIGAWPLIMCATMVIQQKLNPKPSDPAQAMVMNFLPFIFLFLFATFPAGLVIYWAWNNTLSIAQQWLIMKRHGAR